MDEFDQLYHTLIKLYIIAIHLYMFNFIEFQLGLNSNLYMYRFRAFSNRTYLKQLFTSESVGLVSCSTSLLPDT